MVGDLSEWNQKTCIDSDNKIVIGRSDEFVIQ